MGNNPVSLSLDQAYIQGLLQSVLDDPRLQIGAWELQPLKGGLELGSAIFRLQGTAESGGTAQSWSLILKTIQPETQFDDPQGYRYWKREVQAYQSGLLLNLPGQVSSPHCYAVQEQPNGSIWIWLEDISDPLEHPWPISIYSQVANRLGQFNGAYLAGHPLPTEDWITRDWLHKYVEHAALMVEFLYKNPTHPLVKSMLPGLSLPLALAVWKERIQLMNVLDTIPLTFCHQDAFGRNLFNCSDRLIAIDWGYAGIAPVGAELAPLIGVAFGLDNFPASRAQELDKVCFDSYLDGLRHAGFTPDPRQVRIGYALTVLLRYVFGATVGEMLPGLLDEKTHLHWAEGLGGSPERAGETNAEVAAYYQSITIEALRMLGFRLLIRIFMHMVVIAIGLKIKSRKP